ncbi:MAG: cyanophycinase [Acidobacteria bacterium]|jgi:cyanophycinase|nr:cyanophycinase [Acidobacteriota bacterium]
MFKKEDKGILVAVGGGESADITDDSIKIIEKFIEYSGGINKAKIIVMTVATNKPEEARERYEELFGRINFKNFDFVNITDRSEAYEKEVLKKIESATGLYFTGGNQLHVTALTGGSPLHQLILDKFSEGLVIGGTSAGAMMMSSSTLVSGETDCAPRLGAIEVAPGMELIDNSIIDTHFSQRGRHGRLLSAVVHNPQAIGIGIDERTAMIVQGNKFEVVGEGAVTVICAKNSMHTNLPYIKTDETISAFGVDFHVLPEGYEYDLSKREPITPNTKKMVEGK